jgi:hypothetical protein
MEYPDWDNSLIPSLARAGRDVPGAIERSDLEPTGAFLFRQDPLSYCP